ncbi:DUF7426 family protein [Glutamicibacter nicotianae]|uniref:DUF7426 family protein n=1 Tax=Glutamicibacter nicotianae TaxID=37929 RepID=UPI00195B099F|nr:hypothetical protein [Glutamicibacter nicotianae]MBM7767361.1 hypothetical protein [Glutamicibacter nicotianae]
MALKDLDAVLGEGHSLPVRGKTYLIPHASAHVALRFQRFLDIAQRAHEAQENDQEVRLSDDDKLVLTDAQENDIIVQTLGPELHETLTRDEGLAYEHVKLMAYYSLFHAVFGADKAEAYWNSGGKAPAPNRAERRTATRTRTGGASTTRKPASRNGTSTPKAKTQTRG